MSETTSNGLTRRQFCGLAAGAASSALLLSAARPSVSIADDSDDEPIVVRIVVSNSAPPYCYADEDGNALGYDVDTLKLCEEKLGGKYEFQFDTMTFNSMIASLQSGACDLVSCALARTVERMENFIFPDEPYCVGPMCAAVRKDSGINDVYDLAGKTLVVNPTAAYYQALVKYNEEHPDEAIDLVEVSNGDSATLFRSVANGQYDGYYVLTSSFDTVQEGAGTDLVPTETITNGLDFFMLRPEMQELADDISVALREAKEDGSLLELQEEWLGGDVFGDNEQFIESGVDIIVGNGDTIYSVSEDGILVEVETQDESDDEDSDGDSDEDSDSEEE